MHTNADGDSIYALSTGEMPGDVNVVGAMAALAIEKAIARATRTAESAYGLPGCRELGKCVAGGKASAAYQKNLK